MIQNHNHGELLLESRAKSKGNKFVIKIAGVEMRGRDIENIGSLSKTFSWYFSAKRSMCATSPCLNDGQCVNKPDGGFECVCKQGYTGSTCDGKCHVILSDCISLLPRGMFFMGMRFG